MCWVSFLVLRLIGVPHFAVIVHIVRRLGWVQGVIVAAEFFVERESRRVAGKIQKVVERVLNVAPLCFIKRPRRPFYPLCGFGSLREELGLGKRRIRA